MFEWAGADVCTLFFASWFVIFFPITFEYYQLTSFIFYSFTRDNVLYFYFEIPQAYFQQKKLIMIDKQLRNEDYLNEWVEINIRLVINLDAK